MEHQFRDSGAEARVEGALQRRGVRRQAAQGRARRGLQDLAGAVDLGFLEPGNVAVELPSVGVAFYVQVYQAQALLIRPRYAPGQQNGPGAGAEDRGARAGEVQDRAGQVPASDEAAHRRALAAGQDQVSGGKTLVRTTTAQPQRGSLLGQVAQGL